MNENDMKDQSDFPRDPFQILDPEIRWVPSAKELKEKAYDHLLPPLVHKIRIQVKQWRDFRYRGASPTSIALLNYWFNTEHKNGDDYFQYYFAQREAVESVIYLYEVAKAREKHELIQFDSSERVSKGMFLGNWTRYVIKMATGTGKTKVISLVLAWSYFHKLYEEDSDLSRNFLIIAPNIIVLNRLRKDFDDPTIFRQDPIIPENGYQDRDWRNDFQLTLHIQDELKPITGEGNLFLTNIHRVYLNEPFATIEEEFLGKRPAPDADTSKGADLGKVVRSDKIKDLVVFNDEAHHIHDEQLQWFQSIEDVNNQMKLKTGHGIALQLDTTATPKHSDGSIFVETICDYPLVEAIRQNVVKSPVLPDEVSRAKITEQTSDKFVERYKNFIELGYIEWEQQYEELKNHKTPILFVMTNVTSEADETKEYLERIYPKLKGAVLVIHTNRSGDISESGSTKKKKEELEKLREAADNIDSDLSKYKAVVSVMMLREGWDVKNVSTIVGLRPYGSPARILPEQTLGRGLRKMFGRDVKEELVVVGTPAFIEFVESIKTEGVQLGYRKMGPNVKSQQPLIIEVDSDNANKDIDKLDIQIPILTSRIYREYKNLEEIDVYAMKVDPLTLNEYTEEELKQIIFRDIDDNISHTTVFSDANIDYRNVIGFFTQSIMKENRLVSGFNILYPKVEVFIRMKLFGKEVDLQDRQIIRNLSEINTRVAIFTAFKNAINELTIRDKGSAEVRNFISLKNTRPTVVNNQRYLIPQKSIFNKIVGDSDFELEFAAFLEQCNDIISFAKNNEKIVFKIEYQADDGNIKLFIPDFFVKATENEHYIIETKGREDLDDIRKRNRLITWCNDVNHVQDKIKYNPLYVKQEIWEKYRDSLKNFRDVIGLGKINE